MKIYLLCDLVKLKLNVYLNVNLIKYRLFDLFITTHQFIFVINGYCTIYSPIFRDKSIKRVRMVIFLSNYVVRELKNDQFLIHRKIGKFQPLGPLVENSMLHLWISLQLSCIYHDNLLGSFFSYSDYFKYFPYVSNHFDSVLCTTRPFFILFKSLQGRWSFVPTDV